ncbi:MAG: integration host factor subunit beta [bacterium]|nr:MAG: integration host factor subunit beta [bacterium]
MTKSKLVEKISENLTSTTKKDIKVIVDVIFDSMIDSLKKGERIEIRGFGSFKVKERNARNGRNPKTGIIVNIPEKKTIFFKPGKELKKKVDY